MHRGLTTRKGPALQSDPPASLRILLVEDHVMIGILLSDMLEGLGHTICATVATEAAAIAAALYHKPDLLIVDVKLVHGTGIAAVEKITQIHPVPHFFITGEGTRAVSSGSIVLQKPFREADLIQAIRQVLE